MFWLGVPQAEIPRAKLFAADDGADATPYAVIHPFASAPDKTWPADRFIAIAQALTALDSVFLAGPDDDVSALRGVSSVVKNAPLERVKSLMAGRVTYLSATIADRRISRRRSAFPWWRCSDHPIPSRGLRGARNRKC